MTNITTTNNNLKQMLKIVFLTILMYLIILIILIIFSAVRHSNGGYGILTLIQPLYCEGLVELKKEDLSFITEASLESDWVTKLKLMHEDILRPIRNNMSLNNYTIVDLCRTPDN